MADNHNTEFFSPVEMDPHEYAQEIISGKYQKQLEALYSEEERELINDLCGKVMKTSRPKIDAPYVFILPGNLMAQLSKDGQVIWIDLIQLLKNWRLLSLEGGNQLSVTGSLTISKLLYAKLFLAISLQGYRTFLIPYDWRLSFQQIIKNVSKFLYSVYERRQHLGSRPCHIVTHSEGGMLGRAALIDLETKVDPADLYKVFGKLVMIASPNQGFWAMIQIFQGEVLEALQHVVPSITYQDLRSTLNKATGRRIPKFIKDVLPQPEDPKQMQEVAEGSPLAEAVRFAKQKLHRIAKVTTAEEDSFPAWIVAAILTKTLVFTWPAYYEMLPFYDSIDSNLQKIYTASEWPRFFPQPDQDQLDSAIQFQNGIGEAPQPGHPGYGRWHLLLGTEVTTLTNVELREGLLTNRFVYTTSENGDGIVAENLARMENLDLFTQTFPQTSHLELVVRDPPINATLQILEMPVLEEL